MWDALSDFFFLNRICFLKRMDSETGRIELSNDMHFQHVGWKTVEWHASLKRKKFEKSHNFWDISKIYGMNVRRPDNYPEKKSLRFSKGNFRRQKIFHKNSSFFDFCKKISIFANEKFIFLEMKSIVQKRKMSRIFRRQVHGNRTEITTENFF